MDRQTDQGAMLAARHTPNPTAESPSRDDLEARLHRDAAAGLRWWSTGPGDAFDWHTHDLPKVLFCHAGSITFHTREGDLSLGPGDRLDLDPGTEHAATIGAEGCECVEAFA